MLIVYVSLFKHYLFKYHIRHWNWTPTRTHAQEPIILVTLDTFPKDAVAVINVEIDTFQNSTKFQETTRTSTDVHRLCDVANKPPYISRCVVNRV